MSDWRAIGAAAAADRLKAGDVVTVDIRDAGSFARGHIPGALHLADETVASFLASTARDQAVIVCCYHGISSQGAAGWLVDQGFTEVYSLEGGFSGWESERLPIST